MIELKPHMQISLTLNEIEQNWETIPKIKRDWLIFFNQNEFQLTISTCLTNHNLGYYEKFLSHFQKKGHWAFFGIIFSPIGRGKVLNELIVDPQEWIETVQNLSQKYPVILEQSYILSDSDLSLWVSTECPINSLNYVVINYLGEIYPCFLLVGQKHWQIGSWQKKGDLQIALNKILQNFNKMEGCPAYYNEKNQDYRENIINKKGYPCKIICPLYTFKIAF
jgi:radical SAM protein with 4Fe4S-binding SPASM domain